MTANLHPLPREATGTRVIPMRRTIYTEARTIYTEARKIALSAGNDWPRLLGAAQTLSQSPDWTDAALARHIRDAYSLHLAGLLKPVDPAHRDRSDMVDRWREGALRAEAEETSLKVAMRYVDRWPEVLLYAAGWASVMLLLSGWL